MPPSLSHSRLWTGIDQLARRHGLSVSGLAKAAGLDPTAFNKSKRVTPEGRPRWPSTESLSRILEATGASLDELTQLIEGEEAGGRQRRVPLIGLAQAGAGGYFDDAGFPSAAAGTKCRFPT